MSVRAEVLPDETIGREESLGVAGGRGKGQVIHQADQADKNAVTAYHSQYLLGFELGTEMLGRRARAGKPSTRSSSQFNNLRFVTTSQLTEESWSARQTSFQSLLSSRVAHPFMNASALPPASA
jgi:hypothetical protein